MSVKSRVVRKWRLQFSLRQLFFGVMIVCVVCLGVRLDRHFSVVTIRRARNDDPIYERYFGIHNTHANISNIAVVVGSFDKRQSLSAELLLIEHGQIVVTQELSIGRTSNYAYAPNRQKMHFTLALASDSVPNGSVVSLGCVGQSRGSGGSNPVSITFDRSYSDTFEGTLNPRNQLVIHAQGNEPITLKQPLSVAEFGKAFNGRCVAVAVRLNGS